MKADNALLNDEEQAELTSAFNAFTRSGTVPHKFHSEEMYHFFEEFTLALTFPSAVDCGEKARHADTAFELVAWLSHLSNPNPDRTSRSHSFGYGGGYRSR